MSEAQLTLQSKEASEAPFSEPKHQSVEAFDTAAIAERSALGETVSQLGMQMSGDVTNFIAQRALTQPGVQMLRTGLHAGVAGVSAAMSGHSVSGAVAGVVAGDLATAPLAAATNTSELGKAMSDLARNAVAGIAGFAAGAMVDGEAGAFSGANQAIMADAWNRQLHAKESQTLDELMQEKSLEEQKRLVEAAASLTKASAGVPDNDPKKAQLIAMEARGKAHTAELKQLRETGLYQHQMMDGVWDWLGRHDEEVQRGLGAAQMLMGRAGMAGGISLTAGGPILGIAGLMFAGWSANAIAEGTKQAVGTYQSTEGQRVLDALDLAAPHPGDRNRPLELATEAGIAAAPWAAGKLVNTGMHAFHEMSFFGARKTQRLHSLLRPEGDLLGYAKKLLTFALFLL